MEQSQSPSVAGWNYILFECLSVLNFSQWWWWMHDIVIDWLSLNMRVCLGLIVCCVRLWVLVLCLSSPIWLWIFAEKLPYTNMVKHRLSRSMVTSMQSFRTFRLRLTIFCLNSWRMRWGRLAFKLRWSLCVRHFVYSLCLAERPWKVIWTR